MYVPYVCIYVCICMYVCMCMATFQKDLNIHDADEEFQGTQVFGYKNKRLPFIH